MIYIYTYVYIISIVKIEQKEIYDKIHKNNSFTKNSLNH
jgi:hypothetical protein